MSGNTYWVISLVIGLAAALIVATLLVMLLRSVASIERSVGSCALRTSVTRSRCTCTGVLSF